MPVKLEGLPARLLAELGVKSLYPTQEEAVKAGVLEGENVVLAASTASGKTLAAMLAAAAALERGRGRVVYTCPLRSIAMEKYREFTVFERLGFEVKVSTGDYERGIPDAPLVITTYEKLDSTMRTRPGFAEGIGLLIVDEIHYIGDPDRGPALEALLAKVKALERRPQIVALSATIPNASLIAEWLGARLVRVAWRPVPLYEGVYDEGLIRLYRDGAESNVKEVKPVTGDEVIDVVINTSDEGGQALVFVQSRKRAVQLAKQLAKHHKHLRYDERLAREVAGEARSLDTPAPLREEMAWLAERGVMYHHAGLGAESRLLVEEAFRRGGLAAVVATPTLAAGVNLPARRVVVAEYYRFDSGYRRPISVAEYKQLAGRAGRPGLDPYGEAVIIPQGGDEPGDLVQAYILADPEPVTSRLSSLSAMRHTVLGLIAHGGSREYVSRVLGETLYARQYGSLEGIVEASIRDLERWGLVEAMGEGRLGLTPLGDVVSRYYVDPASVEVVRMLGKVKGDPSDAQLLYVVASMPDMTRIPAGRREGDALLDKLLDVAPEVFDLFDYTGPEEVAAIKTMMILWDWINERREEEIVEEYDVGPGDIASLTETARWLAAAASAMSEVMPEVGAEVARRFRLLEKRIAYGVKPELLPLVAIPGIGRVRARRLYEHGYKLPQDLALADPRDLARIPGIGPKTVASILEFLGRTGEAGRYKAAERAKRKGLLAYMDDT